MKLIPDLSGEKNWKQLGSTHLEFDLPFAAPVAQCHWKPHTEQDSPAGTGTACTGSWSFLAAGEPDMHNMNSHFQPKTIPLSLRNLRQLRLPGLRHPSFTMTF